MRTTFRGPPGLSPKNRSPILGIKENKPVMHITTTPVAMRTIAAYRTGLTQFVDWLRATNGRCR